jgi:hypothetical protein
MSHENVRIPLRIERKFERGTKYKKWTARRLKQEHHRRSKKREA